MFITPVELHNGIYVKRDDLFTVHGVSGGKVRTAEYIIGKAVSMGFSHIVTAGSHLSPQVRIVGSICRELGLGFTAFTPLGALPPEVEAFKSFADIRQVAYGRNNILKSYAQRFAYRNSAFLAPFGMECFEAVRQTASQVVDIPSEVKRVVVPVGSAMSLCGVLHGLMSVGFRGTVLGVSVGVGVDRVMKAYAPAGWEGFCRVVKSPADYHKEVYATLGSITLDPVYEAKCLPYLRRGDLFWVVGSRL